MDVPHGIFAPYLKLMLSLNGSFTIDLKSIFLNSYTLLVIRIFLIAKSKLFGIINLMKIGLSQFSKHSDILICLILMAELS